MPSAKRSLCGICSALAGSNGPTRHNQERGMLAQRMDVAVLGDPAGLEGETEGALQRRPAHRLGGGDDRPAVVAFGREEETGMAMALPALAQEEQRALREGDVAVAIALAATDVQEHALGVNVADLQIQALAQAQAAGVDGDQGDPVIEGRDGGENATDLGGGQDDRELELGVGSDELDLRGPGSVEGLLPEQLDGADGLGRTGAGEAPFGLEVEEVLAQFLGGDVFGGATEVLAQLAHAGQVGLTAAGQQGQEAEVFGVAV